MEQAPGLWYVNTQLSDINSQFWEREIWIVRYKVTICNSGFVLWIAKNKVTVTFYDDDDDGDLFRHRNGPPYMEERPSHSV